MMSSVAANDCYSINAHHFSCSGLMEDLLHTPCEWFLAREAREAAENKDEDEDHSTLSPCHWLHRIF